MSRKRSNLAWASMCLCLCAACVLSGCWDRREVNDVAFVMVSSFDTAGKEGFEEGVLIPLPGQMGGPTGGGGGTGGQQTYYVDSDTGYSIGMATGNLQKRMARVLNFRHRRIIIIGEDLAKRGIRPVIDAIGRSPQHRLSTYLVIAEGRGKRLLSAEPFLERFSGEAIREILNLTPSGRVNVKMIAQRLSQEGVDAVIPVFAAVPNKGSKRQPQVQTVGLALFSDDHLTGIVKGEEMNAFLWLTDRFEPHMQIISVKGKTVDIRVETGEMNLRLESAGSPLKYRLRVIAEGGILEDSAPGDLFDEKNLRELELAWKASLTRQLESAIRKMQRLHCDGMGAGLLLYRTLPSEWEERKHRWKEEFANSQFVVETKVQLRRVGQASGDVAGKEGVTE